MVKIQINNKEFDLEVLSYDCKSPLSSIQLVEQELVSLQAKALNSYLIELTKSSAKLHYLVSPITGGGHALSRIPKLFLFATSNGKKTPGEWVTATWKILAGQYQYLVNKEEAVLETAKKNLAELAELTKSFVEDQLTLFKTLQISWSPVISY